MEHGLGERIDEMVSNEEEMRRLLASLPGVDPNDPRFAKKDDKKDEDKDKK
jgi:hypothetical protein